MNQPGPSPVGTPLGIRIGLVVMAVAIGLGLCTLRSLDQRSHIPPHLLPWLALWGFAGYLALLPIVFFARRFPIWLMASIVCADLVVFFVQRAIGPRDGEFLSLNFLPFWQLLFISAYLGGVLSSRTVAAPGPSFLGKPLWRWGLFVVGFDALAQFTPRGQFLQSLEPVLSAITFVAFAAGLGMFIVGGTMRAYFAFTGGHA